MKFKLDENVPREIADDLTALDQQTDTVIEEGLQGANDRLVMDAAIKTGRVLITLDKGIPALLQGMDLQHAGIVLFRPDNLGRLAVASFVRSRLPQLLQMDLLGRLVVVSSNRIRVR